MSHVKGYVRTTKQGKLAFVHSFENKHQPQVVGPNKGKKIAQAKELVADIARELNDHLATKNPDKEKTAHLKIEIAQAKGALDSLLGLGTGRGRTPVKHVIKPKAPNPGMLKIRDTVTELLRTEGGRKEFIEKIKSGAFAKSLPEVLNLYGVEQGEHHPLPDAFDHTMELFKHLPAGASDNVLWGTLLHDIGKAETQYLHPTRGVVFDNHEFRGFQMVKKVLNRLGFDKADATEIAFLVKHHGDLRVRLLKTTSTHEADKFINHPHFDALMKVHQADVKASGRDPKEVITRHADLKETLPIRTDLLKVAKDLHVDDHEMELFEDGTIALHLQKKSLIDKDNVHPKVRAAIDAALKTHKLTDKYEVEIDDDNDSWVSVYFDLADLTPGR
ncbi:MAG: HD domain-containing protein [Desulfobacterales bacterium]|nr:HD domain-containing protein [Desulfobacterales bacterium]